MRKEEGRVGEKVKVRRHFEKRKEVVVKVIHAVIEFTEHYAYPCISCPPTCAGSC